MKKDQFQKWLLSKPSQYQFVGLVLWAFGLVYPAFAQDPRNSQFDVLHYEIAMTISDQKDTIQGWTEILFQSKRPLRRLNLDFQGMRATVVEEKGTPLEFTASGKTLNILLRERTSPGQQSRIKISFVGKPQDGLIIRKNKYGRRTFFADNWPNRAHFWFPCVDHPSDKATVRFRIKAPDKYSVIANGFLQQQRNNLDATRTTIYDEKVPIPTYCMVFGAAEFDVTHVEKYLQTPLSFWIFPQDIHDALHDFQRTDEMLEYFSRRFGDFPYEKLALVQSSTRFGGMENAGAIFFAERSIGTPRNIEGTAAHEIVHQWFGDLLTPMDWPQLWLSEGFATYLSMQFFEYADGIDTFRVKLRQSRERYFSRKKWLDRPIVASAPDNLFELLNPNNYTKGGWVLHMLRRLVGENVFWKGLRAYVSRFKAGNVRTEDFRKIMEEMYGKPLDWFFRQWVYQGGIPELEITTYWNEAGQNMLVHIAQVQHGLEMKLPIEIQFKGEAITQKTVWLNTKEKTFSFYFPEKPKKINVDPFVNLLARIKVKEGFVPSDQ